jgi:UDP-glucuronate decarboxylase
VTDLVAGLISLMNHNITTPINIGNPEEYAIKKFAEVIKEIVGSKSEIIHLPAVIDDPQRRRPNITKAKVNLKWEPKVPMMLGLKHTIKYFKNELEQEIKATPNVFLPKDHEMPDWRVN